jgi:serine/threonine protein kinase
LYEFGGVRANVEFVDICRALDKRKWDLVSKIGSGGFGAVYRCRWVGETKKLAFGTPIAIKIIDLENDEGEDISTVNREIDALAEGQLCPQLTKYYDSGISGSELWIAMEFIDGGSVAALVREKPMKEDQIAFVCKEIIFGLQYLARHGSKIHRDIKGANILLSKDGRVKIADFGASRLFLTFFYFLFFFYCIFPQSMYMCFHEYRNEKKNVCLNLFFFSSPSLSAQNTVENWLLGRQNLCGFAILDGAGDRTNQVLRRESRCLELRLHMYRNGVRKTAQLQPQTQRRYQGDIEQSISEASRWILG